MRYATAAHFRTDCARLRLLAMVTAGGIVCAIALSWIVPLLRSDLTLSHPILVADIVRRLPDFCYVVGIVFMGHALGRLAKGRPLQATLAQALRRIGWTIGIGSVLDVFVVTNVIRWILGTRGGYGMFDVGSITLAILGGALIMLGYVIDHAVRLQGEMDEMF
ncbi:hypothetical protein [Sphingomonas sp. RS2018]